MTATPIPFDESWRVTGLDSEPWVAELAECARENRAVKWNDEEVVPEIERLSVSAPAPAWGDDGGDPPPVVTTYTFRFRRADAFEWSVAVDPPANNRGEENDV